MADTAPAGSVRQERPERPAGLAAVPIADLAAELLHRLVEAAASPRLIGEADVRLGLLLARELEARLDVHQNRSSRTRYHDLFENFHRSIAPVRPPLDGATWVDLGCGAVNPFGALFLFLALGARRGIALDVDGVQDVVESARALADLAALLLVDPSGVVADHPIEREALLRHLAGFDLAKLRAGDPAGIAAERLVHRRDSVHALSLQDGEADVVMSNAFLEHIDRVEAEIEIDTVEDAQGHEVEIKPLRIGTVYAVPGSARSNKAGKQWVHSHREDGGKPPIHAVDPQTGILQQLGGTYEVHDWIRR